MAKTKYESLRKTIVNRNNTMARQEFIVDKHTLFTIYIAGFNHGSTEGASPEHGTFEAFERLIKGESPLLDKCAYDIKDKIKSI